MAGCVALVFNWWNLFVRLADPAHHREAITSRPLLLQAIGRQTSHAGRTTVTITSSHGEHARARAALTRIAGFFAHLRKTAEQLTALERWYRILSEALKNFCADENSCHRYNCRQELPVTVEGGQNSSAPTAELTDLGSMTTALTACALIGITAFGPTEAQARITRIEIKRVEQPTFQGRTFGAVGAY